MTLTFTLNSMFLNTGAGPFDIYCRLSGQTVFNILTNGVESATGITKTQLTNGYTIANVPDTILEGYVKSTGLCDTQSNWVITGYTPTFETRTVIGYSPIGETKAINSVPLNPSQVVYVAISNGKFYADSDLTTLINGWYIWYNDDPGVTHHFIDGVEQP